METLYLFELPVQSRAMINYLILAVGLLAVSTAAIPFFRDLKELKKKELEEHKRKQEEDE
jgi:hypothetical protein